MISINYNNWNKWYQKILFDFKFSQDDDEKSANILNKIIEKKGKFNIENIDVLEEGIVFGAGPSIKKHIDYIKNNYNLKNYTLIAADGATTALLEENIIPDIIVTDLDGNIDSIIEANQKGSILYVHAHGDNIDKIKTYIDDLKNIIPTTQSEKHDLLENYGGFTDGDRAVHIGVYALNLSKIIMAGMDFGNIITNYSRPEINTSLKKADKFKELKLKYAEELITSLKNENPKIQIINLIDYI